MPKNFALKKEQIKPLVTGQGSCIAFDRITVDGQQIGFMYREKGSTDIDSGWRFFAGDESDEYTADASHFEIYGINTIANYDPSIIPHLDAAFGSAFIRQMPAGELVRDAQWRPPD